MGKKSKLEKQIVKNVHPLIIFLFLIFVLIGFIIGYYVKNGVINESGYYQIDPINNVNIMKGDI